MTVEIQRLAFADIRIDIPIAVIGNKAPAISQGLVWFPVWGFLSPVTVLFLLF
jgi:hypothetical protein